MPDGYPIWTTDERYVYCLGRRIRADRASFKTLNEVFARDRSTVFTSYGAVRDADPATFEVLNSYYYERGRTFHSYARDKAAVFFHSGMGKPRVIKGADPATFRWLAADYGADDKRVYLAGYLVSGAEPASFRVLDADYGCDRARCFFGKTLLRGADASSFEVVPFKDPAGKIEFARDAHRVYWREFELAGADPATFSVRDGQVYPVASDKNTTWTEQHFSGLMNSVRIEHSYPAVVVEGAASKTKFPEERLAGLERQILTFCSVVQRRSAAKAAKQFKARLTPETICRHIEELQQAVGSTLAVIDEQQIRVTPDGLAFHQQFGAPVSVLSGLLQRLIGR